MRFFLIYKRNGPSFIISTTCDTIWEHLRSDTLPDTTMICLEWNTGPLHIAQQPFPAVFLTGWSKRTFNRTKFQKCLEEFHLSSSNILSTCSQSYREFSKPMGNECESGNCLKTKNSILRIPQILDMYSIHSAWHTAVIKKCKVCQWCQILSIIFVNTTQIAYYPLK